LIMHGGLLAAILSSVLEVISRIDVYH